MTFFKANLHTGILVLLVVLISIVCVALFFTNKEVRNLKTSIVKSRHDITAIQNMLNDIGLSASENIIVENEDSYKDSYPKSTFSDTIQMYPVNQMKNENKDEKSDNDVIEDKAPVDLENNKDPSIIPSEDIEVINSKNEEKNSSESESSESESSESESSESESDDDKSVKP